MILGEVAKDVSESAAAQNCPGGLATQAGWGGRFGGNRREAGEQWVETGIWRACTGVLLFVKGGIPSFRLSRKKRVVKGDLGKILRHFTSTGRKGNIGSWGESEDLGERVGNDWAPSGQAVLRGGPRSGAEFQAPHPSPAGPDRAWLTSFFPKRVSGGWGGSPLCPHSRDLQEGRCDL